MESNKTSGTDGVPAESKTSSFLYDSVNASYAKRPPFYISKVRIDNFNPKKGQIAVLY